MDISHESLIRQWGRLRDWVDEERRARDEYRELVKKARKWEREFKRDDAALLQGPELQMVVDWREKAAPSPGWASRYAVADGDFESAAAYVDKSVDLRNLAIERERKAQGRARRVRALVYVLLVGIIGGLVG